MTTIIELEHELWLETPKGLGYVLFITDHGLNADLEWDLEWTCIIVDTREICIVRTPEVKVAKNWTLGIDDIRKEEDEHEIIKARSVLGHAK